MVHYVENHCGTMLSLHDRHVANTTNSFVIFCEENDKIFLDNRVVCSPLFSVIYCCVLIGVRHAICNCCGCKVVITIRTCTFILKTVLFVPWQASHPCVKNSCWSLLFQIAVILGQELLSHLETTLALVRVF